MTNRFPGPKSFLRASEEWDLKKNFSEDLHEISFFWRSITHHFCYKIYNPFFIFHPIYKYFLSKRTKYVFCFADFLQKIFWKFGSEIFSSKNIQKIWFSFLHNVSSKTFLGYLKDLLTFVFIFSFEKNSGKSLKWSEGFLKIFV